MKKHSYLLSIACLIYVNVFVANAQERNKHYITNQAPLLAQKFTALPLGDIQPHGWLKKQLEIQRDGLTGNLDEVYKVVVGDNNGWLGGTGDSWERGPYWLDGLTPLAYILDDKALKAKVKKWVDWSIVHQRDNGYFGPIPITEDTPRIPGTQQTPSEDWWPKMVMLKVLQQYYTATNDERVIKLMDGYFRYQLQELPQKPLGNWTFWGERRGGDNLQLVYWLYNITKEDYLLELGQLIHEQTHDWAGIFVSDAFRSANPFMDLHCVNVAQGVKEPMIYYQQSSDDKFLHAPKEGLESLKAIHGFANGMYGGDEALHGNNPIQGSEFCSAVELMFSLESMLPISGDVYYADYLEKIAFNVLPTQQNDDFTAKQYFQQPNQIKISHEYRNFRDAHHGSNTVYGLTTGYPCCLSNMHQGWPKFTQNLFYATAKDGLAALVYAPSEVNVKVADGQEVNIVEETNYPFEDEINFKVNPKQAVAFEFVLRVPQWCASPQVSINGKPVTTQVSPEGLITLDQTWKKGDQVTLKLPMEIRTSRWYEKSVAFERGPLLYALKVGEDWQQKSNDLWPDPFWEVYPTTDWNYGIPRKVFEKNKVEVRYNGMKEMPWNLENAPITLTMQGVQLPYWKEYSGSPGPLPFENFTDQKRGPAKTIELIPYGCTTLRISQFPVIH